MTLTLEEQLKRLEVLRNALGWTKEEYERRCAALKATYQRTETSGEGTVRTAATAKRRIATTSAQVTSYHPYPREDLCLAPYRFIEVVDAVACPPPSVSEGLSDEPGKSCLLSRPLNDGFCGEIELTLAAESPLLVGVAEEFKTGGKALPEVIPLAKGNGGDWWIPGASIRGMIRAAAETVGYGRLEQLNRNHVFPLRDFEHPYYNDPDGTQGGPAVARSSAVKGGWLSFDRKQGRYYIEPSQLVYVAIDDLLSSAYLENNAVRPTEWVELPIERKYERVGMSKKGRKIDFGKTFKFRQAPPDGQGRNFVRPQADGDITGTLVFSDQVPRGQRDPKRQKKVEYVLCTKWGDNIERRKPVEENAWNRFWLVHTKLTRRKREPDGSWRILEPIVAEGNAVPVFFVGDLENQSALSFAFGLTRLFKIPHRYTPSEMLERAEVHKLIASAGASYKPDLVSALFGYVHEPGDLARGRDDNRQDGMLKGRVAFSGAVIPRDAAKCDTVVQTVMGTPSASFAPFYLAGNIKDWSSEDRSTRIAGRKRYLPRFPMAERAGACASVRRRLERQVATLTEGARANEKIRTRLQFLVPADDRSEIQFTSRIKMHNVTAEEVGLLLFVITHNGDDRKRYRHLLGRAKPFGAGQLRLVSARLKVKANVPCVGAEPSIAAIKIQVPTSNELPGERGEGLCPTRQPDEPPESNASHRPFLDAFVAYMQQEANYVGSQRDMIGPRFLDTPAVRGFFGTSDPAVGNDLLPQSGDTYLALRMEDPNTGKRINPYMELRRVTKVPRIDAKRPRPGRARLLPAPE